MSTKILSSPHPNFPDGLDIRVNTSLKRREETADDVLDAIIEQPVEEYGIAGRVWEAADVLIDYFAAKIDVSPICSIFNFQADTNHDRAIVELGSGTGYVGLKLAEMLVDFGRRNDHVILTDLPDVCPLLEKNLRFACARLEATFGTDKSETLKSITRSAPLSWGNYDEASTLFQHSLDIPSELHGSGFNPEDQRLSHIICSDLVYFPSLLAPLLRSLLLLTSSRFCSNANSPEVIIGYRVRSLPKETAFWAAFGLWFEYEPVLQLAESGDESRSQRWQLFGQSSQSVDTTFIFVARRRSNSMEWDIPPDDDDLLGGVGAFGTNCRRSDDYFEGLLLMQLDLDD